jgi:hypothetical protein
VEHRLFSFISKNWSGVPLRTPGLMLALIRGTVTESGLAVSAEWTGRKFERGVKVTDAEMARLRVEPHDTCPQWNYTIKPRGWEQWN